MDVCDHEEVYVNAILNDSNHGHLGSSCNSTMQSDTSTNTDSKSSPHEFSKNQGAIWTSHATSTLLKLYESKLEMLVTPKKKTKIWMAISENLKDHHIDVTPDQVRWKINALTKKYKQCIDSGQHDKFRYFKEMDKIYAQYNVDCDSYTFSELLHKKREYSKRQQGTGDSIFRTCAENKAMIELRKIRLVNRIEADRNQEKIQLEKQWLEYLNRKEEQNQWKDEMYERHLKLREEELEIKKREIELKETLEYKKIELLEREQENLLQIEREKCDLLKQLFSM